jgi:hypothetical protein
MLFSRFLMIAVSWSTLLAARLPRPFFMFAQAPLAGHPHYGGVAARCPGAGLGRAQVLPGLVLEAQVRPGRRR